MYFKITMDFNLSFNQLLHNEKKKKKGRRDEICSALEENYAQFQNYSVEKLDFFHLYAVQSAQ